MPHMAWHRTSGQERAKKGRRGSVLGCMRVEGEGQGLTAGRASCRAALTRLPMPTGSTCLTAWLSSRRSTLSCGSRAPCLARRSFPSGPGAASGPATRRRCGGEPGAAPQVTAHSCVMGDTPVQRDLSGTLLFASCAAGSTSAASFIAGSVYCTHPGCRNPHHRQPLPVPPHQAPSQASEGSTP
jgi:hypothetical protein